MLQQYVAAKKAHPDSVLMFRMGDFFELFFDDAKLAASELDITLTSRDKGENPIPMAGVPHHAVEGYIAKLVARGHTVVICDQVEDARAAQGLVRRDVTRIITPGTVAELDALEPSRASYLACVVPVTPSRQKDQQVNPQYAVAFLDLLAGEVLCTCGPLADVQDELQRLMAKEILADSSIKAQLMGSLRQGPLEACVRALPAEAHDDDVAASAQPQQVPQAPNPAAGLAMGLAVVHARAFATSTQRRDLQHLQPPRYYALENHLIMDEATRKSLELVATQYDGKAQGSLFAHLNRARTSVGARLLRHWLLLPETKLQRIAKRADVVEAYQALRHHREHLQQALAPIRDLERLSGRVALGRATPRDVQALLQSLAGVPEVARQVQHAAQDHKRLQALAVLWQEADLLQDFSQQLAGALVAEPPVSSAEGGIFARGYHEKLDDLIALATDSQAFLSNLEATERQQTGINTLKVRYNRVFGYYIEVGRHLADKVPKNYQRRQTLANAERFVTPELKDFEGRVLQADGLRRELEAKLFADLLASLTEKLVAIKAVVRLIALTDALAALAEVADKHRYVRPLMMEHATIQLTQARHPVVEVMLPLGEPFVPNDVALNTDDRTLMLITGPNMAGKSTLMRQVALCAIMAQMGGFVPAERATLGICDRLYTRVGAQDNLSQGQSTFMVEMVETANILRHATARSLVLLDEIGRGTSTFDGLSIAWAVAEHLHDSNGCRAMFSTHYHELTALTQRCPRAIAMQVVAKQIDGELVFLRQLQEGGADQSYGIEVARLAHMPESVLARARAILHGLEAQQQSMTPQSPAPPAAAAGSTLPGPPPFASKRQLGLFAHQDVHARGASAQNSAASRVEAHIIDALAKVSIDSLTPLQALKQLHAWQTELRALNGIHVARAPTLKSRAQAPKRGA